MDRLVKSFATRFYIITRNSTINTKINPSASLAYSQAANAPVTENEIISTLKAKLPGAKLISVEDTSGGCGAMFNVSVEANEFRGLSVMKQHRLVYDVLKEQIRNIHGIHLETRAPK